MKILEDDDLIIKSCTYDYGESPSVIVEDVSIKLVKIDDILNNHG